jgi:ferredoxin
MKLSIAYVALFPVLTSAFSTSNVLPSPKSRTQQHTTLCMMSPPSLVDLNQYNLALEDIAQEWAAVITGETAMMNAGARLAAKSSKEIFVDTIQVKFPRQSGGLGLELLEIAGGREDGLGIVVVSGIVEGGSADNSGVQLGDSIAQVAVQTVVQNNDMEGLMEFQQESSVETECLGYDATVDAISSLPAAMEDNEVIVLTLKRLRRKPKVTVKLQYPPSQQESDTTIELFSGENLRRAMLTRGVKLNDALSRRFDSGGTGDCGGEATCSTCVVNVVQGGELLNPQAIQEEQMLKKNPKWRLGCKAIVGHGMQQGEMTIRVNPRQWD